MALTQAQIARFSRHLIMPEVGTEGQEKLIQSKILLIGTGGLGSPLAMYLAAAGVGRLTLVDFDRVDESNLQRQVIHFTSDVGKLKVDSAKAKIQEINPYCDVVTHNTRVSSENAMSLIGDHDVVIDGTDNFPTRYLMNDACVLSGKPNIYGSIFRFEGQATVFYPGRGPCYRCLYPEPPPPGAVPSCAEGGVLGILPGIIGLVQATEAIKIILGKGTLLVGRLMLFNAMDMKFREVKIRQNPECPLCGTNRTITGLIDYEQFCGIGRGEAEPAANGASEISAGEVAKLRKERPGLVLVDVREDGELSICRINGATHIPLGSIPDRFNQLRPDAEIVTFCHHGMRSMKAANFLKEQGYKNVKSMKGGIDAWSTEVDASVPRY
ncbi:molybdopterin-synthase adenylyltransferase MoeB [bacterium]|nr:molybdopterin-synthase adenylyltransferase MoeB [bacterium]